MSENTDFKKVKKFMKKFLDEYQEINRIIEESKNEYEQLKNPPFSGINKCKVCLNSDIEIIFLPCGHVCSCFKCGINLKNCPICREPIKTSTRAYIS